MSTHIDTSIVPEWTTGDRLRKARELADLDQQQLADAIGVSRRSVSTYETRGTKKRPVLLSWAILTGVSLTWLQTGDAAAPSSGPDGGNQLPRLDSNQQPAGNNVVLLPVAA